MVKRKKTTLIGDGCRPNIQVTFLVLLLSCLFSLEHEAAGPHIDFGPICPPPIVRPLVILFFSSILLLFFISPPRCFFLLHIYVSLISLAMERRKRKKRKKKIGWRKQLTWRKKSVAQRRFRKGQEHESWWVHDWPTNKDTHTRAKRREKLMDRQKGPALSRK